MSTTVLIYHSSKAAEYARLVTELLPGVHVLTAATPGEAAEALTEADVLFGWRPPTELLATAPRLRWVQAMGAGIEDLAAARLPAGCLLTRVEGLFSGYMSDYAFAHMLAHAQQLRRQYEAQAEKRWESFFIGKLEGTRLGVAGAGSIGMEVARKGKAFGMEVWALVRSERPMAHVDRQFTAADSGEFAAGVDYLVSSLPHTKGTIGLIDPRHMKDGALLINMGRGATIDEEAILEMVQAGRIQAVLDVFAHEPLPPEHPFWRTPGITITPHISGPSMPADVAAYFADNFRRFATGQALVGLVDRERGY